MDDAIHNSPYPLIRMTTGMNPQSSSARRVGFEVMMHEAYGSDGFQWVLDNDGDRLELRVTDSGQRVWSVWMKLGELDPSDRERDVSLVHNILMWKLLRDGIAEAQMKLKNQAWNTAG